MVEHACISTAEMSIHLYFLEVFSYLTKVSKTLLWIFGTDPCFAQNVYKKVTYQNGKFEARNFIGIVRTKDYNKPPLATNMILHYK